MRNIEEAVDCIGRVDGEEQMFKHVDFLPFRDRIVKTRQARKCVSEDIVFTCYIMILNIVFLEEHAPSQNMRVCESFESQIFVICINMKVRTKKH